MVYSIEVIKLYHKTQYFHKIIYFSLKLEWKKKKNQKVNGHDCNIKNDKGLAYKANHGDMERKEKNHSSFYTGCFKSKFSGSPFLPFFTFWGCKKNAHQFLIFFFISTRWANTGSHLCSSLLCFHSLRSLSLSVKPKVSSSQLIQLWLIIEFSITIHLDQR